MPITFNNETMPMLNLVQEDFTIINVSTVATGDWGEYESTATRHAKGSVQLYQSFVQNQGLGVLERTDLQIFLPPDSTIDDDDRIKYNGKEYKILNIDHTTHYLLVTVKKMEGT